MSGLSGITTTIGRALAAIAALCFRNAPLALLLLTAVGAGASWSASRLKLDPDITNLLPPTYDSVRDVDQLRKRFGGVGYVVLLVEGGTPASRRTFADAIAPELEKLETVRFVDHKRPTAFFEDRALYFLELGDLETIRDGLKRRQTYQIERSFLDLDDAKPPPVDFTEIVKKHEARLRDLGGRSVSDGDAATRSYYEDGDNTRLAIFVRPTELASDLDFAKRVVADVEGAMEIVRPVDHEPTMRVALTGRYKKRVDLQAMLGGDLALTSGLALLLVLGYVAVHFRRLFAIVLVLAPLYLGISMSYGVAGALFGKLNILTAFIGAILVGIGIDNGIHMLGRCLEEIDRGESTEDAIRTSFGEAGRVSLAAALTTAAAFGALTWTDFRAFREFGTLAACGMVLVLISYVTLLPALLGLGIRLGMKLGRQKTPTLFGVASASRYAHALFWVGLVGVVLASASMSKARFDADFSRLDDADLPSFHLDKEVNRLLGRSQTPMVVLADDIAEAQAIAAAIREKMAALGDEATIGLVATSADFLPVDQAAKQPLLKQIYTILSRMRGQDLDADAKKQVNRLFDMAGAAPFALEDLPPSLKYLFQPKPGAGSSDFVLLYPTVSMAEAESVRRLAAQLRAIDVPGYPPKSAAGEPMIMADILAAVARDGPRILGLTLVLVFIVLVLTLGKVKLAVLALAPALITISVTLGLLPVLGLDINYLNMVMVPILLGIGVDDGAHLVMRTDSGEPLSSVWRHTGWDVTGAILTDVFGFGVLALATHPGLASLGKLALVGLTVNFLVCVWLLPLSLEVFRFVGAPGPRASIAEKIATMGYAGRSVKAPGTVGALIAIPFAMLLAPAPAWAKVLTCVAGTALAIVFSGRYVQEVAAKGGPGAKDPQSIVIDETIGCLIALLCVPFEWQWVAFAFVAFRLFDIFKPPPIGWLDRNLSGGMGVVLDDVAAGVLAGALSAGLHWFVGR